MLSKALSLAHFQRDCPVQEDGSVKFKWSIEENGVFLADLSTQGKVQILCSYLIKSYLDERDQARCAAVCPEFRRPYSIRQEQTFYIFRLKMRLGRDVFAHFSSFLSVGDYTRIAATHRYAQVIFGNARLIRSVHLVNPGLPKALVACNTNLVALHAIVKANKEKVVRSFMNFVKANLRSLVEIFLDSFERAGFLRSGAVRTAAECGYLSMILTLFNKTIGVTSLKDAIFEAAKNGHAACVKLLMNKISEISEPFPDNGLDEALEAAVRHGHVQCIKTLLDRNNLPEKSKQLVPIKAVEIAAANNSPEPLRILLQKGRFKLHSLKTALGITAELGYLECFKILFGNPSAENIPALGSFCNSLDKALSCGRFDFLKGLLPQYAHMVCKRHKLSQDIGALLISYAEFSLPGYVELALQHDIPFEDIRAALRMAGEQRNLDMVKLFFKYKYVDSFSIWDELLHMAYNPINAEMITYLKSLVKNNS